jgi:cytoskeletal protein CcmA (bactofilin family)
MVHSPATEDRANLAAVTQGLRGGDDPALVEDPNFAGAPMSIFSRKTSDEGVSPMNDASEESNLAAKPGASRPPGAAPIRPVGMAPTAVTPSTGPTPVPTAPTPLTPKMGEGTARRSDSHAPILPTPRRDTEQRRLIVGREISLTGEITSCERLIVEGSVEANLTNCREVEIAESGMMKGTAAIEEAEIRGRFEGNLTVRKRLYIRATGKVTGTVRYGQLEVECGGQVSGDVQAQLAAEDEVRPQRVVGLPGEMKL